MKDIFATIGKILGLVFAVCVFSFTAWMTYRAGVRLIPDQPILQAALVIFFDGAALVWFIQFISQAKGTMQWAIAGIGFFVGIMGAILMMAGELLLGQSLVMVENIERIGYGLIAVTMIAVMVHAILIYAFHFTDPATFNRIENSQKVADVIHKAYSNARAEMDRQAEEMGKELAGSVVYEAQAQIRAQVLPHMRHAARLESVVAEAQFTSPVIDARPTSAPAPQWVEPERQEAARVWVTPEHAASKTKIYDGLPAIFENLVQWSYQNGSDADKFVARNLRGGFSEIEYTYDVARSGAEELEKLRRCAAFNPEEAHKLSGKIETMWKQFLSGNATTSNPFGEFIAWARQNPVTAGKFMQSYGGYLWAMMTGYKHDYTGTLSKQLDDIEAWAASNTTIAARIVDQYGKYLKSAMQETDPFLANSQSANPGK